MLGANSSSKSHKEIVAMAASMIAGNVDLIEGSRQICSLRFNSEDPDNELFMPFRVVESDTDDIIFGKDITSYSQEYATQINKKRQSYIFDMRSNIIEACHELIRVLS